MPVATFPQATTDSEVLALDSGQAADVTLLRADQSPLPAAALFGKIAPPGPPPGVTLPGPRPRCSSPRGSARPRWGWPRSR